MTLKMYSRLKTIIVLAIIIHCPRGKSAPFVETDANATQIQSQPSGPLPEESHIASTPTPTPLQSSLQTFFSTLKSKARELLEQGQVGLLRAIGSIDQGVGGLQTELANSSYSLVLEGQKVAGKLYAQTPQRVNKLIQRLGTVTDPNFYQLLNQVVAQWRDNRKALHHALEEHEYDFHNVFQQTWAQVNEHLRVDNLPKKQLAWYH